MDLSEAEALALAFAQKDFDLSDVGDAIEIIASKTVEVPGGWVFFYNSSRFLKTRNFSSMLIGNKPIFVSHAGACYLAVKSSVEDAIAELAKQ